MPQEDLENTDLTPGSDEGKTPEPSQDPVKTELDEVERRKGGKTEAEKAAFSLKKTAERIVELGGDPKQILGIALPEEVDETAPMTVGQYKKFEAEKSMRTAEQMAEDITDPHERQLTVEYLARVKPSGNPQEDLRFARLAVNSVKSGMIVEELGRRSLGGHSTSSGGPARKADEPFVPTEEEAKFMATFKLTPEQVIAARKANEA
jgi:hypothetical protein